MREFCSCQSDIEIVLSWNGVEDQLINRSGSMGLPAYISQFNTTICSGAWKWSTVVLNTYWFLKCSFSCLSFSQSLRPGGFLTKNRPLIFTGYCGRQSGSVAGQTNALGQSNALPHTGFFSAWLACFAAPTLHLIRKSPSIGVFPPAIRLLRRP